MYICRIVSTFDVNEYTFCVNEQQKVETDTFHTPVIKILIDPIQW